MYTPPPSPRSLAISRRTFLLGGAAAVTGTGLLSACSSGGTPVLPGDVAVLAVESERPTTGRSRHVSMTAGLAVVDLGGRHAKTWMYDGALPGTGIRATAGEVLRVQLTNALPEMTTVHWHGLALRNDMDGVPEITQPEIAPGENFTYEFAVPTPGTYWFHPHHGTQLDRGLYAPLIIEDRNEPLAYDEEWVVVLDDWTDGLGPTPESILTELRAGGGLHSDHGDMDGMDGMDMGAMSEEGTNDALAGDWDYAGYLINGRLPSDPETFHAKPGMRVRIRIINAASDTAFRLWLDEHQMQVTHADGYPVQPIDVGQVVLGMGERYDALVTLKAGVFGLNAKPEGKSGMAKALVRTASARRAPVRPGAPSFAKSLTYTDLQPIDEVRLEPRSVERAIPVVLAGGMGDYVWTINGHTFDNYEALPISVGERARMTFQNDSMMWHPMHLHGHTFAVANANGVRKDTVIVPPMQSVMVDFDADNPGQWMVHCHNTYHAAAGMMTVLSYQA